VRRVAPDPDVLVVHKIVPLVDETTTLPSVRRVTVYCPLQEVLVSPTARVCPEPMRFGHVFIELTYEAEVPFEITICPVFVMYVVDPGISLVVYHEEDHTMTPVDVVKTKLPSAFIVKEVAPLPVVFDENTIVPFDAVMIKLPLTKVST
jgi:hypothetical protein